MQMVKIVTLYHYLIWIYAIYNNVNTTIMQLIKFVMQLHPEAEETQSE